MSSTDLPPLLPRQARPKRIPLRNRKHRRFLQSVLNLKQTKTVLGCKSLPRTIGGRRCLAIGEPTAKPELSTSRRLQAPARHRCVGVPPLAGACPRKASSAKGILPLSASSFSVCSSISKMKVCRNSIPSKQKRPRKAAFPGCVYLYCIEGKLSGGSPPTLCCLLHLKNNGLLCVSCEAPVGFLFTLYDFRTFFGEFNPKYSFCRSHTAFPAFRCSPAPPAACRRRCCNRRHPARPPAWRGSTYDAARPGSDPF